MPIQITTLPLGPLETNCIILASGQHCVLVDPGMWPQPLLDYLSRKELSPSAVWLTHGHGDHIGGLREIKAAFGACRILCPRGDADMLTDANLNMSAPFGLPIRVDAADELIDPGQSLAVGQTLWQVLDTAGHTPGGVSFYCPAEKVVLTGDALFASSIGRTDLPGASAERLLGNIRRNLLTLPDDTAVIPGHGPATTIGQERAGNPYL